MKDALATYFRRLANLPEPEIKYVLSMVGEKSLERGDPFIREGDLDFQLGFVTKGLLKAYYLTVQGKQFIRGFYREGEGVTAYSDFIGDTPASINIEAIEETELFTLPREVYAGLFNRDPAWERFGRVVVQNYMIVREKRERSFLIEDAATRYRQFLAENCSLIHRIRDYEIASYLGITPVSFSRLRKELRDHDQCP